MSVSSGSRKQEYIQVRITTMDADLEFSISRNATGNELFDQICRTIGLREIWYFGLQYTTAKGGYAWLQLNKKVTAQCSFSPVSGTNGDNTPYLHFLFLAKFFPEDVSELIQEITQHLFFLQVRQSIIAADVPCQPEFCVLLASYACQAKYGDYNPDRHTPQMLMLDELLPQTVIDQYQMTTQMWQDRVKTWWSKASGVNKEEAELEYLRTAQDLDAFGVTYVAISNRKDTDLLLGVTAMGLHVYERCDKLRPKTTFLWSEIRNIAFNGKKFVIRTGGESPEKLCFVSQSISMNRVILDLCVGYHDLYLRRRQPDSLELQQMKLLAKEDRARKQEERGRLHQEVATRQATEAERDRLAAEVAQLQKTVQAQQEALLCANETADLLAEKARLSEEEASVLAAKLTEKEAEILRYKGLAVKSVEERAAVETCAREVHAIARQIYEENERRSSEASHLKDDLARALRAERQAKDHLQEVMMTSYTPRYNPIGPPPPPTTHDSSAYARAPPPFSAVASPYWPNQSQLPSQADIDREQADFLERSRNVQRQLDVLRSEFLNHKIEQQHQHPAAEYEYVHPPHIEEGIDPHAGHYRNPSNGYSHSNHGSRMDSPATVGSGSEQHYEAQLLGVGESTTKSRIALFEGL